MRLLSTSAVTVMPEEVLASYHPSANSSCITSENQLLPPAYDLQIIIPCYNVARTVRQCLDSVLGQTTRFSFLIVAIDDGSTDATGKVLDLYRDHPAVEVIHQENRGLSGARNRGLQQIKARYVTFLDSDDALEEGALEALLSVALTDADLDIIQGSIVRDVQGRTELGVSCSEYRGTDKSPLYGYACGKIYKAELFQDCHFPEKFWFEDTLCEYILHRKAHKIATIAQVVYRYYDNPGGITRNAARYDKVLDTYWVSKALLDDARKLGLLNAESVRLYYEMTLCDARVNALRVLRKNRAVRHAMFWATKQLLDTYFPHQSTADSSLQPLEQTLRRGDYARFQALILTS